MVESEMAVEPAAAVTSGLAGAIRGCYSSGFLGLKDSLEVVRAREYAAASEAVSRAYISGRFCPVAPRKAECLPAIWQLIRSPAYAYLSLFRKECMQSVAQALGPSPMLAALATRPRGEFSLSVLAGAGPRVAAGTPAGWRPLDLSNGTGFSFVDVMAAVRYVRPYQVHASWAQGPLLASASLDMRERVRGFVSTAEELVDAPGFCYLRLFEGPDRQSACAWLGIYPALRDVARAPVGSVDKWLRVTGDGVWHVYPGEVGSGERWSSVRARVQSMQVDSLQLARFELAVGAPAEPTAGEGVIVPRLAERFGVSVESAALTAHVVYSLVSDLDPHKTNSLKFVSCSGVEAKLPPDKSYMAFDCAKAGSALLARQWLKFVEDDIVPRLGKVSFSLSLVDGKALCVYEGPAGGFATPELALPLHNGFVCAEASAQGVYYVVDDPSLVPPVPVRLAQEARPVSGCRVCSDVAQWYLAVAHWFSGVHDEVEARVLEGLPFRAVEDVAEKTSFCVDFGGAVGEWTCVMDRDRRLSIVLVPPGVSVYTSRGWKRLTSYTWMRVDGRAMASMRVESAMCKVLAFSQASGYTVLRDLAVDASWDATRAIRPAGSTGLRGKLWKLLGGEV